MKKIIIFLLLLPSFLFGNIDLKLTNYINDYNGLLKPGEISSLNKKLSDFEKKTDIEVSFAIINGLEGRDIESYSNELFKQWGVGKADRNNGLLIVISTNDRKWRIEVGYGLEPYLTDGQSKDIGDANFKPNFRSGSYFTGIDKFIDAITSQLSTSSWEDRKAYAERQAKINSDRNKEIVNDVLYIILGIVSIFVFILAFILFKRKIKREKEFKNSKEGEITKYKNNVNSINDSLSKYNLNKIQVDQNIINLIESSKNINELVSHQGVARSSLVGPKNLINTITEVLSKIEILEKTYLDLHTLEVESGISPTHKHDQTITILNPSSDIQSLKNTLSSINMLTGVYKSKIEVANKYKNIKSSSPLVVGTIFTNCVKSLSDKFYKSDNSAVESLSSKLENVVSNFNSIPVDFNNYKLLLDSFEKYSMVMNETISYFDDINNKNKERDNMISTLNGSSDKINSLKSNLNKYLSNSDVSSSTKTSINSFISGLVIFKVTSDILNSFNSLVSIVNTAEKLDSMAKSDIDEEEERRRRKKQEEEDAIAAIALAASAALAAEEESSRRSSESYSSSSDSSFGGFGGGDSGGGGSSGSW